MNLGPKPLCLVALGVLLSSAALPARADLAGAAANPDSYTTHTLIRESIEFNRHTLAEAYKEVGRRDPRWDPAVLEFLDAVVLCFTYDRVGMLYRPKDYPSRQRCEELGRAALAKGCDDPLVLYLHTRMLDMVGQTPAPDLRDKYRAAYDAMRGSRYPAFRLYAAAALALAHAPQEQHAELQDARDSYLLKAVEGPFLNAAHRRILAGFAWSHYDNQSVDDVLAFYNRLKENREADPWIVNFFGGQYHINAAWESRGSGWANTVTPEGWRGFFSNLAEAEKCLNAAWKLHPDHPEAPTLMITVAMGGGRRIAGSEREWFDRAVTAQLDHLDAYSRLFNALLPRWGGSHEKMLELGLECARTERYDTDVPYQLIEAMERIRRDSRDASLWSVPEAYQAATRVLDTYAQKYHDHPIGAWCASFHAALAWRLQKYDEARGLLDQLGDRVDLERFTYLGANRGSIAEIYARTGPHAADVRRALQLDRDHKFTEALALFREIDGKTDDADRAAPFLMRRITFLDRAVRYESGQWVSLMPVDADLSGMHSSYGTWRLDEQKRLVGTNEGNGLFFSADFATGPRYELSVTLARAGKPADRLSSSAVTFNYDYTNPGDNLTLSLDYQRGKADLFVYGQFYRESRGQIGDPVTVRVRCFDGRSVVTVAGLPQPMRHRRPSDAHALTTSLAGVGCMNNQDKGTLYVTDWKIRKLDQPPGPTDD